MGEAFLQIRPVYYFRLEEQLPDDHLLRPIGRYIDLGFVQRTAEEVLQLDRATLDRSGGAAAFVAGRLPVRDHERAAPLEEVRMHLAYRWFTRLDFSQEIPDHSTFSKNGHGRFRQSNLLGSISHRRLQLQRSRCVPADRWGRLVALH